MASTDGGMGVVPAMVAERLDVSQRAVTKHVTSIFSKLDLSPTVVDHRRVLAVLDLRPLLSAEPSSLDRRGRLVVLTRGGVTAGLLTEGVEGTADIESESVEPSLAHLPSATGALISGQITDERGPVGVLDLEAVFGLADTLARSRRAV